jgi:hypothetical protein
VTNLFMVVDPASNLPVAGFNYALSADGVIDFCSGADDM